jgi:hypothetical protein
MANWRYTSMHFNLTTVHESKWSASRPSRIALGE